MRTSLASLSLEAVRLGRAPCHDIEGHPWVCALLCYCSEPLSPGACAVWPSGDRMAALSPGPRSVPGLERACGPPLSERVKNGDSGSPCRVASRPDRLVRAPARRIGRVTRSKAPRLSVPQFPRL